MNPDHLFALFKLMGSVGNAFTTGVEQGQNATHIHQPRPGRVRVTNRGTKEEWARPGEVIKDAEVLDIRKTEDDPDAP